MGTRARRRQHGSTMHTDRSPAMQPPAGASERNVAKTERQDSSSWVSASAVMIATPHHRIQPLP
jgi:hypothetical protein